MNKTFIVILIIFINCLCFSQSTDLTRYLPSGYVSDASVDYTTYLQKGLNENVEVTFPDFPVLVNQNGLNLKSNQTLNFPKNACLIMKPNAEERYGLLNLKNVSDVVINNPVLVGDRKKHLGTKGEWGMGINILSSQNIIVNNPNISDCWGDGIYAGEILHKDRKNYNLKSYYCQNITIKGGLLDNNRRNGISVISVKGLLIEDMLIQNTNGKLPMAGIDIEPNNNEQFLEDIIIRKVTTKNNEEIGIKYVSSNFIGKRTKNISIRIEDCKDFGSKIGLFLGGAIYSKTKKGTQKMEGNIDIINFDTHSNQTPIKIGSNQRYNPQISVESLSIYNNKQRRDSKEEKKLKRELKKRNIKTN